MAAAGKLRDLAGSRAAVRAFGVSGRLADMIGTGLPFAELATALALLPDQTAPWGAGGAAALLIVFIAAMVANLAKGRRPDCHCFGQLHATPVGPKTVVRNVVLLAAAVVVLAHGTTPALAALLAMLDSTSGVARWAFLLGGVVGAVSLFTTWFCMELYRQNGRLLQRIERLESMAGVGPVVLPGGAAKARQGLTPGSSAPNFRLPDADGVMHGLEEMLTAGKPLVLVFVDPNCGPCHAMLPGIVHAQERLSGHVRIAVLSKRGASHPGEVRGVLLQQEREVGELYGCVGTPGAVLVMPDGRIGSYLAMGVDAVRALITETAAGRLPHIGNASPLAPASAAPKGEMAPGIELPSLDGERVQSSSYRGRALVLLFWNPACGFCARMLPELKQWEAEREGAGPALLVVSTGTVEANRRQGLRSTVVLDSSFAAGRRFGARGTPSAILLDPDGRAASGVEVGAVAVLALLQPSAATREAAAA